MESAGIEPATFAVQVRHYTTKLRPQLLEDHPIYRSNH